MVIADGHGAYDVMTLVAGIERRPATAAPWTPRAVSSTYMVTRTRVPRRSRCSRRKRRVRWEWRRSPECGATRLVSD